MPAHLLTILLVESFYLVGVIVGLLIGVSWMRMRQLDEVSEYETTGRADHLR